MLANIKAAIDQTWGQYDVIGLRLQSGAETQRTKVGDILRRSSVWVDGTKTRRKLAGTAAFVVRGMLSADADSLARVHAVMARNGYMPSVQGDRLVVVGSNRTDADGEQMPEAYSAVLIDAKLLAVIEVAHAA